MQIGQIGFFLESLMRDKTHEKMDMKLVRRLAANYGVNLDTLIALEKEKPEIIIDEDNNFIIKLRSFKEIINLCEKVWRNFEDLKLLDDNQKNVIKFLISTIIPRKFEYLNKTINNTAVLKDIIEQCESLGLIIFNSGFYFSQKLFQNLNKNTMDLLTEYNLASGKVISEFERIEKSPAYPLDSIDERIQNLIKEGAFKGILIPIPVKLPDNTSKSFLFTNPKTLENGDLVYETAAYFRFNEIYTVRNLGKLDSPIIFLDKLINTGTAGDATNIGTNYFPLEVKGVIKIVEGSTSNKNRMVSLKTDILKDAKDILNCPLDTEIGIVKNSPSWLSNPAGFRATFSNLEIAKRNTIELKKLLRDVG